MQRRPMQMANGPSAIHRTAASPSQKRGGRRVVASTPSIDMHGRRVQQRWDLDRFASNPVLLFEHNQDENRLPIGTASVRVVGTPLNGRLEAELDFDTELSEFNAQVAAAWDKGLLNGVSVGWVPVDFAAVRDVFDEDGVFQFTDYPHNRLVELSVTSIPSNDDTIRRLAASISLDVGELVGEAPTPRRPSPRPVAGGITVAEGWARLNKARLARLRGGFQR